MAVLLIDDPTEFNCKVLFRYLNVRTNWITFDARSVFFCARFILLFLMFFVSFEKETHIIAPQNIAAKPNIGETNNDDERNATLAVKQINAEARLLKA